MTAVAISGALLSSIVVDRDGERETLEITNRADNAEPVPFSIELTFADASALGAVALLFNTAVKADASS